MQTVTPARPPAAHLTAPRQILRDYQVKALDDMRGAFLQGHKSILLVAPTGAGKTSIAAELIHNATSRGRRVIFLAHRRELVNQCSARLDGLGVDHGIIQADHWRRRPHSLVHIASIQTLVNRTLAYPPSIIVIDECFPAGTLVDGRRIEDIRVGDTVSSWNHQHSHIESRPVTFVHVSFPHSLCRVFFQDGTSITCTPGHPFFTFENGYVEAIHLKKSQTVLRRIHEYKAQGVRSVRDAVPATFVEQPDGSNLQRTLQRGAQRGATKEGSSAVRGVWNHCECRGESCTAPTCGKQAAVFGGLQAKTYRGGQGEVGKITFRIQQEFCGKAHEGKQPNEECSHSRESQSGIARNGVEATDPGREWEFHNSSEDAGRRIGMGDGDRHLRGNQGNAASLETRHWKQEFEDRHRSGWTKSSVNESERSGREEDAIFEAIRVDRVEIQESGRDGKFGGVCPNRLVYNLEVEGNHNYFANGILVHNCHRARAASYGAILERYPNAVKIGLTATPVRTDGRGLGNLFTAMVQCPSVGELTAQGYLVPTRVFAPSNPDLGGVRKSGGDYTPGGLQRAMDRPTITGDIVAHWLRHGENRITVLFAAGIEHSLHLRDAFRAAGVDAEHLDGNTDTDERDRLLESLAAGRIRVLCSVGVLTEGWDCPTVSCAILARPTASTGLYLQMAGRILRPAPGKADALIFDHARCTLAHGFVDEEREWSLDVDRPGGERVAIDTSIPVVCPQCFAVYRIRPRACECGYVFSMPERQMPRVVDGELVEISAARERYSRIPETTRKTLYMRWVAEGVSKGYKAGYAGAKFKAMFGGSVPMEWMLEASVQHREYFAAGRREVGR